MISKLISHYSRLVADYRRGVELFLLFDYDGTLAPFADDPSAAILPVATRSALERLAQLPQVHLGIISGRQLSDLSEMVGIPGLFLGGTSGLELDFRGVAVRHPRSGDWLPELDSLALDLGEASARFSGAWLERKRLGLTLHYRAVSRHRHVELRALVSLYVERCLRPFAIYDGSAALEIVPAAGWNKGTAVDMFLNSTEAGRRVAMYAGDSSNDAAAMKAVLADGGIAIGVGRDAPPHARCVVSDPLHLGEFLLELATTLGADTDGQTRWPRQVSKTAHV